MGADTALPPVAPSALNGDAPRAEQRTDRPARNGERGERGERSERGGRSERGAERGRGAERNENGERAPRADRGAERAEGSAEGRAERGADGRDGRNERRPDRRPRQDSQERPLTAPGNGPDGELASGLATQGEAPEGIRMPVENRDAASAGADQGPGRNEGQEGREKRSRDRYGRERGPRSERPPRADGEERQDRPMREMQQPLEGFAPPAATPHEPVALAQPGLSAAAAVSAPSPAPMAAPTAAGLPKVQPFVLPMDELAQVANNSGLSWVNSDAAKISAVQATIAAQPAAIHVPRPRPLLQVADEGPLVLVETKRDLRNMTLPFEQTVN